MARVSKKELDLDKTRLELIKELLEQVISLPPEGGVREEFLRRAGAETEVREEVMRLVGADARARAAGPAGADPSGRAGQDAGVHHAPTVPVAAAGAAGSADAPSRGDGKGKDPELIGRYRVLKRLGGGGMGVVYLCICDEDQIRRRVAVKLIKKGMDSEAVLRRFELEKKVLASLKHPNIGGVLDAGMAADGRPFFVMEYVEGQTLLEYADSNQLSISDRLKLFMKVCSAVHAAHQNLIVHRDIKPGNILVGVDGEPRLLDFGIAKLLNPDQWGDVVDVFTGEHQRLMTPEYASPEQVKGDPITTSSDVYSLGVLLYELLTGIRPYSFRSRLQAEIIRVIAEEEPQRPSTAVSFDVSPTAMPTTGMSTGTVDAGALKTRAKLRSTKPDTLRRELTNDIDDIVLMAMRKSPKRRYASAEQMAEDIRRHLTGQTVIARPETIMYVAEKFVRRHMVGVAVAVAFVVLVTGSAVGMGWAWSGEARARRDAEQQKQAAVEARQEAELQKQGAIEARNAAETAKGLAEAAGSEAAKARDESLSVIQGFLGTVLKKIRSLPGSMEARKAIAEQSRGFLDALIHAATASTEAKRALGIAYLELHQVLGGLSSPSVGDREHALEAATRAVGLFQQCERDVPEDRGNLIDLAWAWHYVADAQLLLGKSREVTVSCQQAVDAANRAYAVAAKDPEQKRIGGAIEARALAQHLIADRMLAGGDASGAEGLLRSTWDGLRDNTNRAPNDSRVWHNFLVAQTKVAKCREAVGDDVGALEIYEQVLATRVRLREDERFKSSSLIQREVPITRERVGNALSNLKRHDEAERALRTALGELEPLVDKQPEDVRLQWDTVRVRTSLAASLLAREDTATREQRHESLELVVSAVEAASKLPNDTNQRESMATAQRLKGELLLKDRDAPGAIGAFRESLRLWAELLRDDSQNVEYGRERTRLEQLLTKAGS